MKNTLLSLLSITILAMAFVGCEPSHHHRHVKKKVTPPKVEVVNTYSVQNQTDNSILYYYVIYDENTKLYYSSSSPKHINASTKSEFATLNWIKSLRLPELISKLGKEALIEEEPVEIEELGEATTEIESDYADIPSDNSLDSMEGVDSDVGGGDADVGGDSGGDAGGGDAGGGDGGGGGDCGGGGDGGGGE